MAGVHDKTLVNLLPHSIRLLLTGDQIKCDQGVFLLEVVVNSYSLNPGLVSVALVVVDALRR